jgi:paraquat-inducible protein B
MELGAKGEDIEEITGPVGAAILSYIDYTINLMINKGPGAPGATRAELEALIAKHQTSIYKTVNLLHTSKVEVIMPNIAALADAVRTARDRANGNPSRENLKITMFQDAKDLEEILKRPNNGAQRIIVSFSNVERAVSEIQSLLSDESKSDLFKGVRSINLEAPENYDTITSEERSVWQWESIMTGWLARLYEPENKTPMIEAVLRVILTYQLKDADEARIQSFFNDLPEKPNETGREAVVRIKSCLNKIISFMKQTAQTLRMMAELSLYA